MTTESSTLTTGQRREALALAGYVIEQTGPESIAFHGPDGFAGVSFISDLEHVIGICEQEAESGILEACQRIVAERDGLSARLAQRTEADTRAWALVDALASEYIDDAMDAVALLAGETDFERVDAYDAFEYAHKLARRAREALEGGAP